MRRILITGITAAAILGTGSGALALSGATTADTTSGHGSSENGQHHRRHGLITALRHHAVHGQLVTKGDSGYVRHDGVLGTVTSVSSTAIGVKAGDGYAETFTVGQDTHVRLRSDGSGKAGSISAVHTGDHVLVLGRTSDGAQSMPTGTATARVIVDGLTR